MSTGLTPGRVLGLVVLAVSLGGGQVLFKSAADRLSIGRGAAALIHSMISPPMVAALALYAAATVLWVYLLHGLPLSRAYPFVALAFALVPFMSWLAFGDALGLRYVLGLALMLSGLYVIATSG